MLNSGLRAPVSTPPDLCDNPKHTRSVQSSGSHAQKNALLCQHQSPPEEGGYDKVQKSYHRIKGKGVPRVMEEKPSPPSIAHPVRNNGSWQAQALKPACLAAKSTNSMCQGVSWSPPSIDHICGIPQPQALSSRTLGRKGASLLLSPAPVSISKGICLGSSRDAGSYCK